MFGIGGTELLVILVVALVVLGPKSLPQIAKTLGRAMGEFRRVSTEFQRTLNVEIELEDHEKRKQEAEEALFGDTSSKKSQANDAEVNDTPKPTPQNSDSPRSSPPDLQTDVQAASKNTGLTDHGQNPVDSQASNPIQTENTEDAKVAPERTTSQS